MGTSQPYSAPSTPQWATLKTLVTNVTRTGGVSAEDAQKIVRRFVDALSRMRGHTPDEASGGTTVPPTPLTYDVLVQTILWACPDIA